MNNSFIFTQPAAAGGVEGRGSRVESQVATNRRHSNGTTQPFSNVLDRAVQSPQKKVADKPKHEALTGGRSAEHRSARSVEAHEEHKPATAPRGGKRRDKHDDEMAVPSAGLPGMPTPVAKPDEISPESGTSDAMVESSITVANCSAQKAAVETVTDKIVATLAANPPEPTVGSAEISLESLALVESEDVAVAGKTTIDLKQLEQVLDQDASQPTKTVALDVEETVTTAAPETFSEERMTSAMAIDAADLQAMAASTAREALRGAVRGDSNLNPAITTPEIAAAVDEAGVESVVVSPIAAEEARRSVRTDRESLTETREKSRGTAAAKLTMSMNNEANREEIAGLTGQVLPGSGGSQPVTGINLPSESATQKAFGAAREIIGVDSLNAAARLTTGPARTDVSLNTDLLEMREASPAARIGEVISREVRMFKRGGDERVEVVLTPDAKTQISLKLQWRDGQVEVQARCDMGDHHLLNTQWPQLQASFAAHGVRLSHLSERAHTGFTEFFGNSGFSQQQGGERQPAPQPSAIDAMKTTVPTPKTGAARSVVRSSNRLESWA